MTPEDKIVELLNMAQAITMKRMREFAGPEQCTCRDCCAARASAALVGLALRGASEHFEHDEIRAMLYLAMRALYAGDPAFAGDLAEVEAVGHA